MRIEKVEIRNVGPLTNATWDIDPSLAKVILCGDHGVGKSTFLKSINRCLSQIFTFEHEMIHMWQNFDEYQVDVTVFPTSEIDSMFLGSERKYSVPSNEARDVRRSEIFGHRVPFACVLPSTFTEFYSMEGATWYSFPRHCDPEFDPFWISTEPPHDDPIYSFARVLRVLEDDEAKDVYSIVESVNKYLSQAVDLELVVLDEDAVKPSHSIWNPAYPVLACRLPKQSNFLEASFLSEAQNYALGLLLVGLVMLPSSSILLIDSPETFLNPSAQSIILSAIAANLSDGQLIIATHSPSLIASQRGNQLYLLERNSKEQRPKRVNDEDSVQVIRNLYGEHTSRSVLNALSDYSSTAVLSYLIECTVSPEAIRRGAGDPQIQQLAMWISGYAQKSLGKRLTIVDMGAGKGDLLDAICASGCDHQIIYIPVEPDERYWESIQIRMRQIRNLEFQDVRKTAKDLKDADVVFLVNVLHELDLHPRVELISQSLDLTYDRGVVVIHEVASLPIGEAGFVMWSSEDLRTIFENAKMRVYITSARTKSRPGGWPIETTCIKSLEAPPKSNRLLDGAILSLPDILKRWTEELAQNPMNGIREELKDRIKAFRMAQVANLAVWNQKYATLKL